MSEKLLMEMKTYKLRYLPLFEEDVKNVAAYISHVLQNPDAAHNLIILQFMKKSFHSVNE